MTEKHITWFESATLGEILPDNPPGLPAIYVFPKDLTNTHALAAIKYSSIDRRFRPHGRRIISGFRSPTSLSTGCLPTRTGATSLSALPLSGADANAYTSYDRTIYHFNCTENFETAFGLLLQMLTHPYFSAELVEREQGIIAQEIGMYEDDPGDVCYQNLLSAMYHIHPVRVNVCGTVESISRITPELLYDCHSTFYSAPNMVVILCGRVDPESVARSVADNIPATEAAEPRRFWYEEPAEVAGRRVTARRQVSKPVFAIGVKKTDISPDQTTRLKEQLLHRILNHMIFAASGELYNSLYDQGLITAPLAYSYEAVPSGGFSHVVVTGAAWLPDEVFRRTQEYISALRTRGIDKADFERGRRVLLSRIISQYDSTERTAHAMIDSAFRGLDIFDEQLLAEEATSEDAECFSGSFTRR